MAKVSRASGVREGLGVFVLAALVGGCDMPWTTDTGQRIRRECESIVRAAAQVAPDRMNEQLQENLVLECLAQSAGKGRQ